MNRQWKLRLTPLIILLVILPGFLSLNAVFAKNFPVLSITVSATSITVGSTITVKVSMGGATSNAGGTITVQLFASGSCFPGTIVQSKSKTATPLVFPVSKTFTMNSAGAFSFDAIYSGDTNNYPATSLCKGPVVVLATSTTITTTITMPTFAVGSSTTDSSTLAGVNVGATTTGTVIYKLFSGGTCSGATIQSQTVIVAAGAVPTSAPFIINTAGPYSLQAVYSGDSRNLGSTSICESPLTVNLAAPTISTTLIPASPITLGSSPSTVTDTATFGSAFKPTGTVTYKEFADGACVTTLKTSQVTVTSSFTIPNSAPFPTNTAGTFSFQAFYSGDQNNSPANSGCGAEPLTVNKATPITISTTLIAPTTILAGQSIQDSATLTGATFNAGGTVTYTLRATGACGGALDTSMVTVTNGVVPNSKAFTINVIGTYSMDAIYSGDANNAAAGPSACEAPITVNIATPTISTLLSATTITVLDSVTDSATLSGATSIAGGTVDYKLFAGSTCMGGAIASDLGKAVVGGVPAGSRAFVFPGDIPSPGAYSFNAVYSGDANNMGPVTSACEPLTVNKASPSISTALTPPSPVDTVMTVKDTATISGAAMPTGVGTVTYKQFLGAVCSGAPADTDGPFAVVANGAQMISKSFGPFVAGAYSFNAVFTGDANNNGVTSACEPLNAQAITTLTTTITPPGPILAGGTTQDSAVLGSSTATAGGTVTYFVFAGAGCPGAAFDSSTSSVTNHVPANSKVFEFDNVGMFSFMATYSGDTFNQASTSACEGPLVVNKATPTLSTLPSSASIMLGSSVTDTATLTSASPTAGGTVTFQLKNMAACGGAVIDTDTEPIVSAMATSKVFTPGPGLGGYSFSVTYSGDANNMAAGPVCEDITVTASIVPLAPMETLSMWSLIVYLFGFGWMTMKTTPFFLRRKGGAVNITSL